MSVNLPGKIRNQLLVCHWQIKKLYMPIQYIFGAGGLILHSLKVLTPEQYNSAQLLGSFSPEVDCTVYVCWIFPFALPKKSQCSQCKFC